MSFHIFPFSSSLTWFFLFFDLVIFSCRRKKNLFCFFVVLFFLFFFVFFFCFLKMEIHKENLDFLNSLSAFLEIELSEPNENNCRSILYKCYSRIGLLNDDCEVVELTEEELSR